MRTRKRVEESACPGATSSPNKIVRLRDTVLLILLWERDSREPRRIREKYGMGRSAGVDYVNFAGRRDMHACGVATEYIQTLLFARIGIRTGFLASSISIFQIVKL